MKYLIFLSFYSVAFLYQIKAQEQQRPSVCSTMEVDSVLRLKYPHLGGIDQFEQWVQQKTQEYKQKSNKTNLSYTLPVIVHIIHNGEAIGVGRNISDSQVQSQIDALNRDFRKQNTDIIQLQNSPFDTTNWASLAADCEFNFCLVEKDTNGNMLTYAGIERIDKNTFNFSSPPYSKSYVQDSIKPKTIWNPYKYVNIWVLDLNNNEAIAYANLPPLPSFEGIDTTKITIGDSIRDGIVIDYKYFGDNLPVSLNNMGRIAVHEAGHWLGLRHIWGDRNCGDDYCADTPTQKTFTNGNCPSKLTPTCNNKVGDMFVNYMDYSADACRCMFTNDQKIRMHAITEACTMRASVVNQTIICSSTSIKTDEKKDRTTYPNPSDGIINVSHSDKANKLKIYDLMGKEITFHTSYSGDIITIDLSDNPNGYYLLHFTDATTTTVKKIILNRAK